MSIGPWQIALLVLVVLVLFGRGRISEFMGDFGKGIKSFKKGMNEDDPPAKVSGRIEAPADIAPPPVAPSASQRAPVEDTKTS
ncbi:MAG: twin-arginine translocase TatA/TatE family subunit [Parerythrobacter sp.]